MVKIEALDNGDVRLISELEGGRPLARQFRSHFGHVVEVQQDDRVRYVGPGLEHHGPSLIVHSSLLETVRRATGASGGQRSDQPR